MKIGTLKKNNRRGICRRTIFQAACAIGLFWTLVSCGGSPGYSFTIGGIVSGLAGSGLVLQNNGGDDLTVTTNGSFSFHTAVPDGGAYSVTVATQPGGLNQTCTVVNPSGTVNGVVNNVQINCLQPPPRLAIDSSATRAAAIKYSGTTTPFSIDSTGLLTAKTVQPAGTKPNSVTIADIGSKKIVYVANFGTATTDGSVSVYEISDGGTLTKVTSSADVAAKRPYSITIADMGSYTYAFIPDWASKKLYKYKIDTTTGALQDSSTSGYQELDTDLNPSYVSVRQIGATSTYMLFVACSGGDGNVKVWRSLSGGAWSDTGFTVTATNGVNAGSVFIDPAGAYAHVVNTGSNAISVLSIKQDGTDIGSVSLLATVATGSNPITLVTDQDRKFAYVPNYRSNSISVYGIGTDGNLSAGTAVAAGTNPYAMDTVKIDSTHLYAYAVNYTSNDISVYSIDPTTGALTSVETKSIKANANPYQIIIKQVGTKYYAYVLNAGTGDISIYSIGATDGKLTLVAGSPVSY